MYQYVRTIRIKSISEANLQYLSIEYKESLSMERSLNKSRKEWRGFKRGIIEYTIKKKLKGVKSLRKKTKDKKRE